MSTNRLLGAMKRGFADLRSEMNERFSTLRGEMNAGFEKVDQRFEKVDQRFEKVDQRFDGVEDRLKKVEDLTHGTRIMVEDIQHNLRYIDDMSSEPGLARRVSALEVRVTKLEKKRK